MKTENTKSIRDGFGEALLELGQRHQNIVALSADLTESVRMHQFAHKFPERFLQMGIGEQNMAGVAAGLALEGFTAFIGSFACFQPMRNLDQIRTSICIMNANVKIVSSHAGFSFPADGVQIQALEDIAIMRSLPNMQVIVPADAQQAKELTMQAAQADGPVYIRLGRAVTPLVSDYSKAPKVELGKVQIIKPGKDMYIFSCGYMLPNCYQAIQQVKDADIGLVNVHTIKPLDAAIAELAASVPKVLTVEEHQKAAGLGSAIAELLAEKNIKPDLKIMGVNDRFGETAQTSEQLWEVMGLSVQDIVRQIQASLKH